MSEYVHGSHSVFFNHHHIVWITKYRKKILTGDVALKLRDIIRQICQNESVEILRGHVGTDHVHIFVSGPPRLAISKLLQQLKGKSSRMLMMTFPKLQK
jgi:putative transposase